MSEELTLDDRRKASNHVQVTLVIALRESQLVVLGAQVTFINTWWHVAHDVYLVGTMSKRIRFI